VAKAKTNRIGGAEHARAIARRKVAPRASEEASAPARAAFAILNWRKSRSSASRQISERQAQALATELAGGR
jgi:hypothetical protein